MKKNLSKNETESLKYPIIILSILGFIIFANGLGGDFVYDDHLVLSHSLFSEPLKALGFIGEPYFDDYPQAGLYRPLTQISFSLNFLFSRSPVVFHMTNLFLHIANSILIFYLVRLMSGSRRISWISSLLFTVLPMHAEAVSSIVGRAELLFFFFSILSIIFWIKGKYLISAALFFGALLSKETAITLPFVLIAISLYSLREGYLKKILYFGSFAGTYFILRWLVLRDYMFSPEVEFVFNPLRYAELPDRIYTALKVLSLYLYKIFWPVVLSPDYSFDQIKIAADPFSIPVIFGAVFLAGLIFFTFKFLKAGPRILILALTVFLLPYLLISNLVITTGTIMAERLMYLPSLGPVIIVALGLDKLLKKYGAGKILLGFMSILLFFYSWLTIDQNTVWADNSSLFSHMYAVAPDSIVAKYNFAKVTSGNDLEGATALALEAYARYPDFVPNLNLLGSIEKYNGNYKNSKNYLERAHKLKPKNHETLELLARVYYRLGDFKKSALISKDLVSGYGGAGNVAVYILAVAGGGNYRLASDILNEYSGELDPPQVKFFRDYLAFKEGVKTVNKIEIETELKNLERGI